MLGILHRERQRLAGRGSRFAIRDSAGDWMIQDQFFAEPRTPFPVPAMKNRITRAYRLADHAPIDLKTDTGTTTFNVERPMLDPMATVVVVEFEGQKVERSSVVTRKTSLARQESFCTT
jgi:hypothetical protein